MGLPVRPRYRRSVASGMIIERDVAVELRDGIQIFIDVFRPENELPAAPLIGHDRGESDEKKH